MKTIIVLSLLTLLTACQTQPPLAQDPRVNPQMLSTNDLLKVQIEKMERLERDMEKRETALKYEHLKELQAVQSQVHSRSSRNELVNTSCKFFCF
jgi:hypothetical protein